MIINDKKLTPRQEELLLMLLREEAALNRHNDSFRARSILEKLGEEAP